MNSRGEGRVTITEQGRSGTVIYGEGDERISGWWEFGGGDTLAIVHMGSASEWVQAHPWAADHRSAILHRIADEVVRQKAAGRFAEIDEEGGWITIRQAT
ncbi:MAG: hypothetical protein KDB88_01310, partial [Flavobacteriales bacterium]|nr:hypothetical protein [Flavobacteriales bacterium]